MSFLRRSGGFTLIELVSMLVIFCVLAAVSLPKALDLRSSATRASFEATVGAFKSSIVFAHAICQMKGGAGYGAGNVVFNPSCNPAGVHGNGNADGNGNNDDKTNGNAGAMNGADCVKVWKAILSVAPSISNGHGADYTADGSGNTCTYGTPGKDPSRTFVYDSVSGDVTITANP